jgi:hypothetical protein
MIRLRTVQLDSAAQRAIEWLRAPKPLEEVAPAVLAGLAQGAGSLWAAHWVIDTAGQQLRPFATWSGSESEAPLFGQDARLLSLGFSNAAVVWCGRKPVWSTTVVPASLPPPESATSPRLYGAVWFALKTDTAVYGVIELLGKAFESKAPEESLGCLERLGFRLGLALEESLYRDSPAQNLTSQQGPFA